MASDADYVSGLIADGRVLRLAAAIAWASDTVDQLAGSTPQQTIRHPKVLH